MLLRYLLSTTFLFLSLATQAANIVIVNMDGAGEGLNDATVVTAIGGNPATTLGQQRINVFQQAADILESYLDIQVNVNVEAKFDGLTCDASSAILGSAGAIYSWRDFTNSIHASTWYPEALANNLYGSDYGAYADSIDPGFTDANEIRATFNSNIDNNNNCLNGVDWYYGFDDPALAGGSYTNDSSLLSVVIHEILHGLGVASQVDSLGALNSGYIDAYSRNLYDSSTTKSWTAMTNGERATSIKNTNNLVWNGSNVNSSTAALALTNGLNSGKVEMYAPSSYEQGSSVSHFSKDATPNEIMEPSYTEFLTTPGMATQLLQDMGWAMAAANNAPILASIGALSSVEDNNKVVTLSATDTDSNPISFSASSDNGSVTASVSGTTLTLTPTANYFGSANITVTANDGTGTGNATDTEIVVYTITSDNDLPIFTSAASGSTQYSDSLAVTLSATDIETVNSSIGFSLVSSNTSEITASTSGSTLTLIPINNYIGDTTLTLRATDGNSGSTDQSYTLTITAAVNDAPVFTSSNSLTTLYGNNIGHSLTATDADLDGLSFNLTAHDAAQVSASLTGSTLTLQAINNFTGSTSIEVSVFDGSITVAQTINLIVYQDFSLASSTGDLSQGASLPISNSTFEFTLGGGDNSHSVEVVFDGQNETNNLLTFSAGSYSLAMPESGAFAGDYTITITDGNSESADFIIQRPLRVTTNINELIAASTTQEMYIEGAPASSVLDLHITQGVGLLDLQINNATVTQVVAPDDANNFNRAVVSLDVHNSSAISTINISADSAILPAGSASLTTLPFHDVELTVNNSSGEGISASITINDDRFATWGLNQQPMTDNSGSLVFTLPKNQATLISLTAENYQAKTVEVDPLLDQLSVVLELLENPMTISGSITTSTLDFINEEPVVTLFAQDNATILAEISVISSGSVNYSVTINKLAFDADKLTISHGDITQEIRLLNNQVDSIINIHIDALQAIPRDLPLSDIPNSEEPVIETSSAGGNSYALILCLLLLINYRKRKTL
ncbi:MAG: cadherin-like domain-containing protein [Oleispira sp.]